MEDHDHPCLRCNICQRVPYQPIHHLSYILSLDVCVCCYVQGAPLDVSSCKPDKQDKPVSEDSWDDDSDLSGSGGSEGEEGGDDSGRKRQPMQFVGGLQLSDQLQLLSPTSKSQTRMTSKEDVETSAVGAMSTAATEDVSTLYAKVNKKKKSGTRSDQDRPRTVSDPTPTTIGQSASMSRSSSHSMSSDCENKERDKSGHFKPSTQPPWVEMVCIVLQLLPV